MNPILANQIVAVFKNQADFNKPLISQINIIFTVSLWDKELYERTSWQGKFHSYFMLPHKESSYAKKTHRIFSEALETVRSNSPKALEEDPIEIAELYQDLVDEGSLQPSAILPAMQASEKELEKFTKLQETKQEKDFETLTRHSLIHLPGFAEGPSITLDDLK